MPRSVHTATYATHSDRVSAQLAREPSNPIMKIVSSDEKRTNVCVCVCDCVSHVTHAAEPNQNWCAALSEPSSGPNRCACLWAHTFPSICQSLEHRIYSVSFVHGKHLRPPLTYKVSVAVLGMRVSFDVSSVVVVVKLARTITRPKCIQLKCDAHLIAGGCRSRSRSRTSQRANDASAY